MPNSEDPKWQRTQGLARGVLRLLCFCKLVDEHDGNLSLSSSALIATTAAVSLDPSPIGLAAMIGALLLYGHKRYVNGSRPRAKDDPALLAAARQMAEVGMRIADLDKRTTENRDRLSQELNRGPRK